MLFPLQKGGLGPSPNACRRQRQAYPMELSQDQCERLGMGFSELQKVVWDRECVEVTHPHMKHTILATGNILLGQGWELPA